LRERISDVELSFERGNDESRGRKRFEQELRFEVSALSRRGDGRGRNGRDATGGREMSHSADRDGRMRAFRIAYDGTPFYGFQRQPTVPTVEDALLDAIRALGLADENETPPGYAAAGRTDAGVSALAQTVGFRCPAWCSPAALNSRLPATVRAWAFADTESAFHATHDAHERTYTYDLYAPDLDDGRAAAALARLCGEHDFHNLTPDDEGTVRSLSGSLARDGDFLVVTLAAPGFVRQQVRRVVSLVHAVGDGAPLATVERLLAPGAVLGEDGIPPAAAEPLVFTDVSYPGLSFSVDADAAESTRTLFGEWAVEARTRGRVTERIRDGVRFER
jgi:tRNA pseudouridine38-40 synthase